MLANEIFTGEKKYLVIHLSSAIPLTMLPSIFTIFVASRQPRVLQNDTRRNVVSRNLPRSVRFNYKIGCFRSVEVDLKSRFIFLQCDERAGEAKFSSVGWHLTRAFRLSKFNHTCRASSGQRTHRTCLVGSPIIARVTLTNSVVGDYSRSAYTHTYVREGCVMFALGKGR